MTYLSCVVLENCLTASFVSQIQGEIPETDDGQNRRIHIQLDGWELGNIKFACFP